MTFHIRNARAVLLAGTMALALGACDAETSVKPVYDTDTSSGDPKSPADLHARAVADFKAARFEDALRRFRAELERNPGALAALNGVAASYDRQGRYELALRYYERALAHEPDHAVTLNNLGYSYLLQGRVDLAYVHLAGAMRRAPDNAVIRTNFAAAARLIDADGERPSYVAAPVTPVRVAPIPAAGSYGFQRVGRHVYELVRLAPGPQEPETARPSGLAAAPWLRDGRVSAAMSEAAVTPDVFLPGPLGVGLDTGGTMATALMDADSIAQPASVVLHLAGRRTHASSMAAIPRGDLRLAWPDRRSAVRAEQGADTKTIDAVSARRGDASA